MKTMIAVPCMDKIHTEFARCLIDLEKTNDTKICFKQSSLIYDSRNLLSLTALGMEFDRVLWLDSDMTFTAETLTQLHNVMDRGYDLVTGLYVKRKAPVIPVLYKTILPPDTSKPDIKKCVIDYLDYPTDDIFPVAGCGFGCVLTSTALLEKVWKRFGPAFSPLPGAGEDISFCYRAGLVGASMVCDSSVRCGHIGGVTFTPEIYEKQRSEKN